MSPRRVQVALIVPLILVNGAAIFGQAAWARDHIIGHSIWVGILFALAIESIGVYLALEAHDAQMNDQASGLLRLMSYNVGALAGMLNYWHFAPAGHPNATAIAFGVLSSLSPWLWAIRSRAMNRARLRELGQIDARGVRLSTSRKFWHPIRSIKVISWAAWAGVSMPDEAVRGWTAARSRPADAEQSQPAPAIETREQNPPAPSHDPRCIIAAPHPGADCVTPEQAAEFERDAPKRDATDAEVIEIVRPAVRALLDNGRPVDELPQRETCRAVAATYPDVNEPGQRRVMRIARGLAESMQPTPSLKVVK